MVSACVMCGRREDLHKANTNDMDKTLRYCAQEAGDWDLYAKLQTSSEVYASDVYNHSVCLTKFRNAARSAARLKVSSNAKDSCYRDSFDELVMAEVAAYVIESNRVLPVNELACMYRLQRKYLGKPGTSKIRLNKFAEHLVAMAPE